MTEGKKSTLGTITAALKKSAMLVAFLVIVVMFQVFTRGILLVPQNVSNIIQQNS